jgi:hypothetical protein
MFAEDNEEKMEKKKLEDLNSSLNRRRNFQLTRADEIHS